MRRLVNINRNFTDRNWHQESSDLISVILIDLTGARGHKYGMDI